MTSSWLTEKTVAVCALDSFERQQWQCQLDGDYQEVSIRNIFSQGVQQQQRYSSSQK